MSISILILFAVLIGCVYAWIGLRASKGVRNNDDYFLMGRQLKAFPLCMTLLATQLGGGMLLGAAQEAYERGWIVLLYPLGGALGFILLGMGIGARLRRLNVSTVAEIFEQVFDSRRLRIIASLLSVVSFFLILSSQGIAARKFFLAAGVPEWGFLLFWMAFVAYTVMGGLKAVVETDVLQSILILLGLAATAISIDWVGAPRVVQQAAPQSSDIPWCGWVLMPLLFMLIEQDIGQRCFAAKRAESVRWASIAAAVILFASSVVAVGIGVLGRQLGLSASAGGSILVETVQTLCSPAVTMLLMGAVLMAIASTADSLLCSIGSNLSCDLLEGRELTQQQQVAVSRVLTLVTGLSALGVGYLFDNVVAMLILAYELSVCLMVVPVMQAILSDVPSLKGTWCSIALGAVGFVLFRIIPMPVPKEVATIALSYMGYWVGARLTPQEEVPANV